jgi:hypothetical protein
VTEAPVQALRDVIRELHGCDSVFVESVPVVERWQGQTVWEGAVVVFDLIGHPTARRAYAWSRPVQGSRRRRFLSVLHAGSVDSPQAAVRASVAADQRENDKRMLLVLKADRGILDDLPCPWCDNPSVAVRFTHHFAEVFKLWFLCGRCEFRMRAETPTKPRFYSRSRLDNSLEIKYPD